MSVAIAIVAAGLCAAAAGAAYLISIGYGPGGVPPTYAARDGDGMLTRQARSAVPILAAIRQYQQQHGHSPATAVELAKLLPASAFNPAATQMVDGWTYATAGPTGFALSRRLGWDPSLVFHGTQAGGSWAFEPGDGSPERPVALSP